jgi:imidazolonepropionase-like amidohydrolase
MQRYLQVASSASRSLILLVLCSWLVLPTGIALAEATDARPTLFRFAGIIDGTGERLRGHEIIVDGGVIVAIGDDLAEQYPQAQLIDLHQLHAIPGLIDTHLHISYGFSGPSAGDAWSRLMEETTPQERLAAAIENARKTLETGVTTARDLFAFDGVDFQLRTLIDNGTVPGPRLLLSGIGIHPMTLTGMDTDDVEDRVANFSAATQRIVASGADWVKIFATTGSADDLSGKQNYFYPEIKAAVDIAHAAGLRVAVHSYSPAAVGDALRAGVDSIEHPVGLDDDTLQAWAATNIFYVPTIDHNRYYAEFRHEYGYDEKTAAELNAFVKENVATLARAHRAGVRIAMGSDAVMSMFGQNTRELEWFVQAGMTPAEALRTATANAAGLLGRENNLGRLHPGYVADIVAVFGDPLADIQAVTRHVEWVIRSGRILVSGELE